MATKGDLEFMVENLKKWQKIEDASINMVNTYKQKTDNPLITTVLNILKKDSRFHRELQEMLINSVEVESFSMTPDDVGVITELIDKHHSIEKDVIEIGRSVRGVLPDRGGFVLQKFLLDYLIADEEKHDTLLDGLEKVKGGMYPYNS